MKSIPIDFSPRKKIPGAYAYIDLLAHPQTAATANATAQKAMGVGPYLSGMMSYFEEQDRNKCLLLGM